MQDGETRAKKDSRLAEVRQSAGRPIGSGNSVAQTHEKGKKNPPHSLSRGGGITSGNDLLSRAVSRGVPSALEGLTSVFEMGTGVTPPI